MMKRMRFKPEQIVQILREAEQGESTIGELCHRLAIAGATFYRWRKNYGNMQVNDVAEYRRLIQENARLKRIVAERVLEIDAMKEVLSKKW